LVFWDGGALWLGAATGQAQRHAHHAIQLTLSLDAPFRIQGPEGDWISSHGALVLPHAPHRFDGAGQAVAIVFIEPETRTGRALLARNAETTGIVLLRPNVATSLEEPLRLAFETDLDGESLGSVARESIAALSTPLPPAAAVDPRIATAIDWIRAHLAVPIALADVAAVVHLSPGRFRHLFVEQTGTTLRAYLLWARVGAAVAAGMAGRPWSDAAQDAGFADAAHVGRTCRRMIGLAPGMLTTGSAARS
jgi:AraC-like DNA-binding protein